MPDYRRNHQSELAQRIREITGLATAEDGVKFLVDQKLVQLGGLLKPPIPLPIVASICGIQSWIEECPMEEDGRLLRIEGKWHIHVNERHSQRKKRFSAGHEITHKILKVGQHNSEHRCSGIEFHDKLSRIEEEWLCDVGSRHMLLLSPQFLQPIMNDMGITVGTGRYVSDIFDVSFEASARTLVEYAQEPVAVVYYAMGWTKEELEKAQQLPLFEPAPELPPPKLRIVRYYASSNFPIRLPINKSLPSDSVGYIAFESKSIAQATETHTFDGKTPYRVHLNAIGQVIYKDGEAVDGLIVFLSNPISAN